MGAVAAGDRCGPRLLRISWSQIRVHEECAAKGKLLRSGHRPSAADVRGFFHGTVADRVMRAWLNEDSPQPGQMRAWVEEIADREEVSARETGDGIVRWKSKDDRATMLAMCRELADRLEPILAEHVLPHDYEPSRRFRAPLTIPYLDDTPITIQLIGETDVLVRTTTAAPVWRVWDLKATKDDNYWRKTIGQTVFYDLSVFAEFGEFTERVGLFQPMCKERVLALHVTDQQRAEMMQRIVRYCHAVWRDDLGDASAMPLKADTEGCAYCDVRHACPRYATTRTDAAGRRRIGLLTGG